MSNKVLVSWSGGYDSTALILYYLSQGREVVAKYTVIENNESQNEAERSRIEKIIPLIEAKYPNCYIELTSPDRFATLCIFSG